ncbi:MAG: hypothetical protein ACRD1Q_11175 [Vicinamibacterales bacterium]
MRVAFQPSEADYSVRLGELVTASGALTASRSTAKILSVKTPQSAMTIARDSHVEAGTGPLNRQ